MKRHKGQRSKSGKSKSGGVEFCPGYVDEYGIWNNGFTCPKWGGPEEKYCCGAATKRFCCPEPEPLEPVDYNKQQSSTEYPQLFPSPTPLTSSPSSSSSFLLENRDSSIVSICSLTGDCKPSSVLSIPLIAGVSAAVVILIILLISCFACRCCPGYKRLKRTRSSGSQPQTREVQCAHCHRTTTTVVDSNEPTLACGCPIGGPGHSHGHHRESSIPSSDLVLTLFENPNATWQTDILSDMTGDVDYPMGDPPPYKECSDAHDSIKAADTDSTKSTDGDTETTPLNNAYRLSNPNLLCMSTFRPLNSPPLTSPTSFYMPSPRIIQQGGGSNPVMLPQGAGELEYSKRDSGCIDDDQQQDETSEFGDQDHDAASIMVPKFNFQSLSLCRSLNNPPNTTNMGSGIGLDNHMLAKHQKQQEMLPPELYTQHHQQTS